MNKSLLYIVGSLLFIPISCREKNSAPGEDEIINLELVKGPLISCGPADKQLGTASLTTSCSNEVKDDFNLAIKLLHSFEYDESEKAFAIVIDKQPDCAMAYWGIAMSNFHPLWTPPNEQELIKGTKAIQIARSLKSSTREKAYIDATASFYTNWEKTDHRSRTLNFEMGMEKVYTDYPEDKESAIFYALALCASADPNDKLFIKQKKAGRILSGLYPGETDHPGIVHYLIHAYDSPELAKEGLNAARKYSSIAPSSAHALHMPSHIFTRLGIWDECIQSNLASVASAQCYAKEAGIKGHWDEELHGLDYLMYAYLQKGQNDSAKKLWDYLNTIAEVSPMNFKVTYSFAAIPSRYLLENRLWKEAANLKISTPNISWKEYPWQEAIIHFCRLLGSVHLNDLKSANQELILLNQLHNTLLKQKDSYMANQVAIQIKTSEAWIKLKEGNESHAVTLMQAAADMEDKTEKHPVTPGEVIPARELLGELLLKINEPEKALVAFEANLKKHPNRFNGVYGAAQAARLSGNSQKAKFYFNLLLSISDSTKSQRPELKEGTRFLKMI